MRPLDPRLLALSGPARRYILITAVLGFATAVAIGFQALLIARMLAPALAPFPLIEDGLGALGALIPLEARELSVGLPLLAAVVAARVAIQWTQERLAHRAGVRVVSGLREAVVAHVMELGPRWAASGHGAAVTTLVTRGLNGLMPYFVRYVPQLMLAASVTPLMVVVVWSLDWISGLIVVLTIPLVPIFMILIGLVTKERSQRHLEAMTRFGERTLDLIAGVPTLRGLGRERGPAVRVRELGDAQRRATMGSLRVAFLSGMVLELLTTLAVAIVAVTSGFRLVDAGISIETALAVLILAPEVYLPLRAVGMHFHASADGMAAADATFEIIDTPVPEVGTRGGHTPDLKGATLRLSDVSVATPDGRRFAPHRLSVTAQPGQITALVGANGEGKSTALLTLAMLLKPSEGTVQALTLTGTVDAADCDPASWSLQCAWVPQRPDTGMEGRELSLGQRQRLALSKVWDSGRPVLLLDEPTAHLDGAARLEIIELISSAARAGATVVVSTHDEALMTRADHVVTVTDAPVEARS